MPPKNVNKTKYFVYYFFLFSSTYLCSQSINNQVNANLLKLEAEKFQNMESNSTELNNNTLPSFNSDRPNAVQVISSNKDSELDLSNYFGYNFFVERDTISFWENLPVPENYILGPGDEVIVSLWGETLLRNKYIISRDGNIYDDKVGMIALTGKTISEAEKYLKTQFGRIYATLIAKSQSTFMDVTLGTLKSINVNFVGQLKYPGVYPLHPFSNVITGLIQVGGVDTTGTLRKIQINRNGKIHSQVDLYEFIIKGGLSNNIQLRDQDVVIVPPRQSYITIDSAVVNPGIYESIKGESIYDIISVAGGLV